MPGGFRRHRDGGLSLRLEPVEGQVIENLLGQLTRLYDDLPKGDPGLAELGISESTEAPDDPVLARLFPDGYRDDDKASGEFRRYTEASLRDGKERDASIVLKCLAQGPDVRLDEEQAQAWLRALNDLRLAIGTRLDITEDGHERFADLEFDDPVYAMYVTYDWLTQLQDSLVQCLFQR
ncbi:DUF2017 domain-containing protein [Actinocorallia sp. A-T 12471]|uniref:DUF2017 domain-containing protein n=1 Tax=Actinocorallia sp. A-T 12471 TaxID=3089813 RepID=UPI0029CC427D|nr:DUF2017 domain-containing protein [Actinocorallia sp. A-T 12471]MDX6743689.1 DUF2017 domain-containing protein [Actinocorallia sp. A-T 12471]